MVRIIVGRFNEIYTTDNYFVNSCSKFVDTYERQKGSIKDIPDLSRFQTKKI